MQIDRGDIGSEKALTQNQTAHEKAKNMAQS